MKIVILDAQTVTRGDIDLNIFSKYGDLEIHSITQPNDMVDRIKDADIVICNKTEVREDVLKKAEKLKFITLFATGYNNIDVEYCTSRGIVVSNAGSYSTNAVAQHTFALILEHYSRVGDYNKFCADGNWLDTPSFSPFVYPTDEIAGKALGIIGLGSIGKAVADIAEAFKMNVIAYTRTPAPYRNVRLTDIDTLLAESDIVSLHCPLNDQTYKMFDAEMFAKCKDGAYFINTARGAVTDENALREAVLSGKLSGAAIDVLEKEPMREDCPLFNVPGISLTPHVAWVPLSTRIRLIKILCQNIEAFLTGKPINVVN